jgi:hypothetical protein
MVVGLFGRKIIWSRARSFGRECLVAGHLVACHLVIWSRGHLDASSFSRVVIRSHGYLVAVHLVAGHLVAGHLVAGHLVALNEKSILTYLQKFPKTSGFHSPTYSINAKARFPDLQFDAKNTKFCSLE